MAVTPLSLNNGSNPAPAATNTITLREFSGGPIPQPDAEANFVNITDRINALISDLGTITGGSSGGGAVINANTTVNGGLDVTGVFKAGEDANGIPAIDLTYPAGPRLRGGAQGVRIITNNQDSNGNSIDSVTSNAGLTCSKLSIRGGNGPPNSPAGVDSSTSLLHDSDGLRITPYTNNSSNPERVLIEGDLNITGKIICDDLEDSSGNSVGGGGPWQTSNVNLLSNHHVPAGWNNFTVNVHASLPNATEVCIETTLNEQNLLYYNVYTNSYQTIINVGNNYYGATQVCIPLAPGSIGGFASTSNANVVIPDKITPGTIHLRGAGADGNGGHIYSFKVVYWR